MPILEKTHWWEEVDRRVKMKYWNSKHKLFLFAELLQCGIASTIPFSLATLFAPLPPDQWLPSILLWEIRNSRGYYLWGRKSAKPRLFLIFFDHNTAECEAKTYNSGRKIERRVQYACIELENVFRNASLGIYPHSLSGISCGNRASISVDSWWSSFIDTRTV